MIQLPASCTGVLFDLDESLLNGSGILSPRSSAVIDMLDKSGHTVGVATGRNLCTVVDEVLPAFPENSVHTTSNGARVTRGATEVLFESSIPDAKVRALLDTVGSKHAILHLKDVYAAGAAIIDRFGQRNPSRPTQPLAEIDDLSTVQIVLIEQQRADLEYWSEQDDLNWKIMYNEKYEFWYADINAGPISKGSALTVWSKATGVNPDQLIAVGNGRNDLELFQQAAFRVAPANAIPELLELADVVCPHHAEDGVAQYFESIVVA